MLYCGFCETLQHHTCYGYVEANVVTVPDYHVCYECLFAGKPAQLEPFLYLARLRRIVQALRKKSFSKEPELAAAVGKS
jgi:meiosis-specific protein HOP1